MEDDSTILTKETIDILWQNTKTVLEDSGINNNQLMEEEQIYNIEEEEEETNNDDDNNYRNYWKEQKIILNKETAKLFVMLINGKKVIKIVKGSLSSAEIKNLTDLGFYIMEDSPDSPSFTTKSMITVLQNGMAAKTILIGSISKNTLIKLPLIKNLARPNPTLKRQNPIPKEGIVPKPTEETPIKPIKESPEKPNNEIPIKPEGNPENPEKPKSTLSKPSDKSKDVSVKPSDDNPSTSKKPENQSKSQQKNSTKEKPERSQDLNPLDKIPKAPLEQRPKENAKQNIMPDNANQRNGWSKSKIIQINYDPKEIPDDAKNIPQGFIDNIRVDFTSTEAIGSCTVHYYTEEQKQKLTAEAQTKLENMMGRDSYLMKEMVRPRDDAKATAIQR